jgi:hypothetical protein
MNNMRAFFYARIGIKTAAQKNAVTPSATKEPPRQTTT